MHCTMLCVSFQARACFAVTCVARMHGPCLSTGWALNRRFDLTFGTAAVVAQGGGLGGQGKKGWFPELWSAHAHCGHTASSPRSAHAPCGHARREAEAQSCIVRTCAPWTSMLSVGLGHTSRVCFGRAAAFASIVAICRGGGFLLDEPLPSQALLQFVGGGFLTGRAAAFASIVAICRGGGFLTGRAAAFASIVAICRGGGLTGLDQHCPCRGGPTCGSPVEQPNVLLGMTHSCACTTCDIRPFQQETTPFPPMTRAPGSPGRRPERSKMPTPPPPCKPPPPCNLPPHPGDRHFHVFLVNM